MTKDVSERIDEVVFQWFGHVERMDKDTIAKRVYESVSTGSCSVGRENRWWIDTLKERSLDVRQSRRMGHDRSIWQGFVRRDEPLTLTRFHSYQLP